MYLSDIGFLWFPISHKGECWSRCPMKNPAIAVSPPNFIHIVPQKLLSLLLTHFDFDHSRRAIPWACTSRTSSDELDGLRCSWWHLPHRRLPHCLRSTTSVSSKDGCHTLTHTHTHTHPHTHTHTLTHTHYIHTNRPTRSLACVNVFMTKEVLPHY